MLLTTELRTQDRVARSGGEEFQVLLPDTGLERAQEVAERLRAAIERMAIPFLGANGPLPIAITASLGVATLGRDQVGWEPLQYRADQAMYAAKRLGRNRVLVEDFGAALGMSGASEISS
jgi:diguanylate cyclase (GGDEF)-like protein